MPDCPGHPLFVMKTGGLRKVCTGCDYPHQTENYEEIISILKTRGFFNKDEVMSRDD